MILNCRGSLEIGRLERVRSVTDFVVIQKKNTGVGKSADISSVAWKASSNKDVLPAEICFRHAKQESNVFTANEYDVGNIPDL